MAQKEKNELSNNTAGSSLSLSIFNKANVIINAKFNDTAMSIKVKNTAYQMLGSGEYTLDEKGNIVCEIPTAKLKKAMKGNNSSFYDELKATADGMTRENICFEDPDTKEYTYVPFLEEASYRKYPKSVCYIVFNGRLSPYLINLTKNFTRLSYTAMMNLKTPYAIRLYEICRSYCYDRYKSDENTYEFEKSFSELLVDIGLVNIENKYVKQVLSAKQPNYDRAVEVAPKTEKHYQKWYEFRRRILEPSIEQINNNKDAAMQIDYEALSGGKGKKVYGVRFTIHYFGQSEIGSKPDSTPEVEVDEEDRKLTDEEKFAFYMKVGKLLGTEDLNGIRTISEESGYDMAKIQTAYEVMESYRKKHTIDNVTGYMIKAIKEDYRKESKESDYEVCQDFIDDINNDPAVKKRAEAKIKKREAEKEAEKIRLHA